MHPAALPDEQLLKACDITRGRRGGPGGQHRNKVETAVRITHTPTGTTAEASERRSQPENRRVAVFRLRVKLAVTQREPWEQPSALWKRRIAGGRVSVNVKHTDYPAVLAESLDAVAASGGEGKTEAGGGPAAVGATSGAGPAGWDVGEAAGRLGVTATQLVKLWRTEPAALAAVNARRAAAGLRPLR